MLKLIQRLRRHIKKLRRLAADGAIDLWFEDECHFQQHGSRCTMWIAPEDRDPVLLHAPTRRQVAVWGAVCSADGRLSTMQAERFHAETFQIFLARLVHRHRPGRKMIVVVDNARWHHARNLNDWLWGHRHVLSLNVLPPSSPQLHARERVWKLTR